MKRTRTSRLEGFKVELWEVLTVIDAWIDNRRDLRETVPTQLEKTELNSEIEALSSLREYMRTTEWKTAN